MVSLTREKEINNLMKDNENLKNYQVETTEKNKN